MKNLSCYLLLEQFDHIIHLPIAKLIRIEFDVMYILYFDLL